MYHTEFWAMVVAILMAFGVYMLPWIIADARRKRHADAIMMANLLFGWTFIGWGVALVWACMEDK